MKWFEGEMVAFDLSAGEQGFPDSVSKQTCSKSRITSEVDTAKTHSGLGSTEAEEWPTGAAGYTENATVHRHEARSSRDRS